MEGVAGMLRGMKLSEEEKKGVKIRGTAKEKGKGVGAQAVGKIFSEKLAHPDAVSMSLGKVWCPIKGTGCREVGENRFVFTFMQESGKRKAIENGPWMFDNDLVVVEEFDPCKRLEDYEFNNIPIWVRVYNLPLGMMNAESVEDIGNIIGQFVEADTGVDGNAIGKYLRIKIRMRIDKPIMRGFTLEEEEEQKKKKEKRMTDDEEDSGWCRFEYEFLPDFCYTCGRLGHGGKDCEIKLKKGEIHQFGKWLKADLGHRRGAGDDGNWRRGGRDFSGSRNSGYNRSSGRSGSGSDSLSWRRDGARSSGAGSGNTEKGEMVSSPTKNKHVHGQSGTPRTLLLENGPENRKGSEGEKLDPSGKGEDGWKRLGEAWYGYCTNGENSGLPSG